MPNPYYKTSHWRRLRALRLALDKHACVGQTRHCYSRIFSVSASDVRGPSTRPIGRKVSRRQSRPTGARNGNFSARPTYQKAGGWIFVKTTP